MTERKKARKARLVVVEAAAADNASSGIAAPADRPTAPVVGFLLAEAAQLGCLPGLKTAQIEDRYRQQ